MNPFFVGIKLALEEYPSIDNDYKKVLNLLLDVYEQYERGLISKEDLVWTVKELHKIIRG